MLLENWLPTSNCKVTKKRQSISISYIVTLKRSNILLLALCANLTSNLWLKVMARRVNTCGSVPSNIMPFSVYKIQLTRKRINGPSLFAWDRALNQVITGFYSFLIFFFILIFFGKFLIFWNFSKNKILNQIKSFRTEMQLQRGAKQRMSVPFERKPSRRYSRRSTFRSNRGGSGQGIGRFYCLRIKMKKKHS